MMHNNGGKVLPSLPGGSKKPGIIVPQGREADAAGFCRIATPASCGRSGNGSAI
jgi:hypothetical protein